MSIAIIIPVRYDSSRYYGKPLAKINGKEMILHVVENCLKGFSADDVFVATDSNLVGDLCKANNYNVIQTGHCESGMIRVAEASKVIDRDIIINLQGDEPLVDYRDILKVIEEKKKYHDHTINCYGYEMLDIDNKNTIKIIENNHDLLYASRSAIPSSGNIYKKQICIYAFYKNVLINNYSAGIEKTYYENLEKIDILRMIEKNQKVRMVHIENEYQSVDVPADIDKVEKILNDRT